MREDEIAKSKLAEIELLAAEVGELTQTVLELEQQINILSNQQKEILEAVNLFIAQAHPIVNQVIPTIEAFTQIPMVRMALGIKKGEINGKR